MRTTLVLCFLAFFTGCARIPEPTGYQHTTQPKMQAAYHWIVLASDVANRINNQLVLSDYPRTPVYVRETCGNEDTPCAANQSSPFTEAFRDLLITELVRFGVPVRHTPDEDALTVHYKVQLVYHQSNRVRTIQPGVLTSIATGIMVFRNFPHELGTIAAVGLLDFFNATAVNSSNNEVIITTSMIAKEKYLFRTSDVYYINDKDSGHYRDGTTQVAADIPLIGPASPSSSQSPPPTSDQGAVVEPQPFSDEEENLPNI